MGQNYLAQFGLIIRGREISDLDDRLLLDRDSHNSLRTLAGLDANPFTRRLMRIGKAGPREAATRNGNDERPPMDYRRRSMLWRIGS